MPWFRSLAGGCRALTLPAPSESPTASFLRHSLGVLMVTGEVVNTL